MPEVKPPKGKNGSWVIKLFPGETLQIEYSDSPPDDKQK